MNESSARQLLRERVLDALDEFWMPLSPIEELRPYLEVLHGEQISPESLGHLLDSERKAFAAGMDREVWLCLGLRPDGRANFDRWARSDWPLWVRVVDVDDEEIRTYWLLRQLYRAQVTPGEPRAEPVASWWIRLAARLPDEKVTEQRWALESVKPEFHWTRERYATWAEVADELFDRNAAQDRERREQVAGRLSQLDLAAQLFGGPGSYG